MVQAGATFANGSADVTQLATYSSQSGTSNVFSLSAGGVLTAEGDGVDLLGVAYEGVTTNAPIAVGPCSFTLSPANQIVPNTGGSAVVNVTTTSDCFWTATGGASWLPLSHPTGKGSGVISLMAAPNTSGAAQTASISLAGSQAVLTQPATSCTYSLSQPRISAPAAGTYGTVDVTTSCPIALSADQAWISAFITGSSVGYNIAPNNGAERTATLTIGTVSVPISQDALFSACDFQRSGSGTVADTQSVINEALGLASAAHDLNGDGLVGIVDLQIEINSALQLGCTIK